MIHSIVGYHSPGLGGHKLLFVDIHLISIQE